jgi:hypothetical protein
MGATHQSDGDVGGTGEDELDFLELAASSPVLRQEDPTECQYMRAQTNKETRTILPRYLRGHARR